LTQNEFGYILGDIFINASGHPGVGRRCCCSNYIQLLLVTGVKGIYRKKTETDHLCRSAWPDAFVKNVTQDVAQSCFGIISCDFNRSKSSPKMWGNSIFFKKMAKVNFRPTGENSPSLVTLVPMAWDLGSILRIQNFGCVSVNKFVKSN
jgi:hypothetical protein